MTKYNFYAIYLAKKLTKKEFLNMQKTYSSLLNAKKMDKHHESRTTRHRVGKKEADYKKIRTVCDKLNTISFYKKNKHNLKEAFEAIEGIEIDLEKATKWLLKGAI